MSIVPKLPGWNEVFAPARAEIERALLQPDIDRAILNVRASWWAIGKSDGEILAKAKEDLIAAGKL